MRSVLFLSLALIGLCGYAEEQVLQLTGSNLGKSERIVAFSIHTRCLRVSGVRSIPTDWTLSVQTSDDGGGSVIIGSCHHGATALSSLDEIVAFGFIFEKECKDQMIEGDISVTVDFEKATKRKIFGNVIFSGGLQQVAPNK